MMATVLCAIYEVRDSAMQMNLARSGVSALSGCESSLELKNDVSRLQPGGLSRVDVEARCSAQQGWS